MPESVLVAAQRDVRGSLDRVSDPTIDSHRSDRGVVVACPPHPQHGGDRHDHRLTALSDALTDRGIDCLRFDYGPWDEGVGERRDTVAALRWAGERYDRVGMFGYSFGASIALLAAAGSGLSGSADRLVAVSALAPTATVGPDEDIVATLDAIDVPVQVVYASRDETADWVPVVDRARDLSATVEKVDADHFFVGRTGEPAALCGEFLAHSIGNRSK